MLESQPRQPSHDHCPRSPNQAGAASARGFGSSACRTRSTGPSHSYTEVAQKALVRHGSRSGPHNIGPSLVWIAPVSEPPQLPATRFKSFSDIFATSCFTCSRFAESEDVYVRASRGRCSVVQRKIRGV